MTGKVRPREAIPEAANPLGLRGIEFVEYATSKPQALGDVLGLMGFRPVARHRSREVTLYRQGTMNVVVNADPDPLHRTAKPTDVPAISAIALRVEDADHAYRRTVALGAWEIPTRAGAMELNIPGIRGVGDSAIYFVDRFEGLTIYDVDFRPIPGVDPHPPAIADLHWFGVVQYIDAGRTADWLDFYGRLMGFQPIPPSERFGILPKGTLIRSPSRNFFLQLIEPEPGADDYVWDEQLHRLGLGAPDVMAAVRALAARGVGFIDSSALHASDRGALTQQYLGGVLFELVHSEPPA
jgi:4-hydroxyphenylpyruvate dioxygenase